MKILLLGLNYLPESTSIGPYTAGLAEYLLSSGYDVRVVTSFPAAPHWKVWDAYRGKWSMRESINGVPVLRTYVYIPTNPRRTFQRILFDCSFALSALWAAATRWRADIVIVVSPPLQLALTGLLIGRLMAARVFIQVQDLVPDAAVAVGALRSGSPVLRLAYALENFIYRSVDGIGVICEGMRKTLLAKGVPPNKVATFPNYIDLGFVAPNASPNGFRAKFAVDPKHFLAMYSGSVAAKQGLQTFLQAAAELKMEDNIVCCLIGDGPYLSDLKKMAETHPVRCFRFLPLQPKESLPAQLSAADVLVITQQKSVRDVVFPGKLLYYMAAGRAIVAAVSDESETGRFIRQHDVGIVVPPEDPARLAQALRWMRDNPDSVHALGLNGRRVVETHFDRTVVLDKFAFHLEGLSFMHASNTNHS